MQDNEIKIVCSGMPKDSFKYVEWEKFKEGFSCMGALAYKHVKGGVKLIDRMFTIKADDLKKELQKF